MSYVRNNWANNGTPAISADNLNNIEEGIVEALDGVNEAKDLANRIKPCDYSNMIHRFVVGTAWTATEDCWVFGTLANSHSVSSNLKINNVEVASASQILNGGGVDAHPTGSFFVRKGSTVLLSGDSRSVVKAYACIQ